MSLYYAFMNMFTATSSWAQESGAPPAAKLWKQWASDVNDMVLSKGIEHWAGLHDDYKAAWLGEFRRRNALAGVVVATVMQATQRGTPKRHVRDALGEINANKGALVPDVVTGAKFTQFCINNKFASQAGGSPGWLASKTIVECARSLQANTTLSDTLRPALYRQGGQWVTLNNRGMALHALAGITPARLGFRSERNTEESGRDNVDHDTYELNFGGSVPDTRRRRADFWTTTRVPVDTVAVVDGSPTNNQGDAVQKEVIYTIKATTFGATDVGNTTVLQTL